MCEVIRKLLPNKDGNRRERGDWLRHHRAAGRRRNFALPVAKSKVNKEDKKKSKDSKVKKEPDQEA